MKVCLWIPVGTHSPCCRCSFDDEAPRSAWVAISLSVFPFRISCSGGLFPLHHVVDLLEAVAVEGDHPVRLQSTHRFSSLAEVSGVSGIDAAVGAAPRSGWMAPVCHAWRTCRSFLFLSLPLPFPLLLAPLACALAFGSARPGGCVVSHRRSCRCFDLTSRRRFGRFRRIALGWCRYRSVSGSKLLQTLILGFTILLLTPQPDVFADHINEVLVSLFWVRILLAFVVAQIKSHRFGLFDLIIQDIS